LDYFFFGWVFDWTFGCLLWFKIVSKVLIVMFYFFFGFW